MIEGLIAGLAGGVGGGAEAAGNIYKSERENKQRIDAETELERVRQEMAVERQKAIDDYKKESARESGAKVEAVAQENRAKEDVGLINSTQGSSATPEEAAILQQPGNEAARRIYGLPAISEADRLRDHEQAASSLGETEIATNARGSLNVERQISADTNRYNLESQRTKDQHEKNMMVLNKQIDAQNNASEKLAMQNALTVWNTQYKEAARAATEAQDALDAARKNMASPEEIQKLERTALSAIQQASLISQSPPSVSGVSQIQKNSGSNKFASLYGESKPEPKPKPEQRKPTGASGSWKE